MPRHEPVPGGYAEVLRIAWPLIISTGSFTVMQFCDRLFLAWHDSVSIQAALPAGILAFTLCSGFMAMAGYANTFVAQYHGSGNPAGCSRATAQGVWLALLSWPLILALVPVGRWLLAISAHPPAVHEQEVQYYTILMAGGVTIPLNAAIGAFFTGRGDTFTNMVATIIANAVNCVLDYALIFGRWGFPELGIRGAAIATVIAGFVGPAIQFALFFSRRMREEYFTRREFVFDRALFLRMIRFGLPSGLHLVVDVASFTAFVLITGRLGEAQLAVSNIAFSINMVAFMPLLGISLAAATLVGQYQGRRDAATAERATWTSLKLGMMYMTVIGATYLLVPEFYLRLFTQRGDGGLSLDVLLPVGRVLLVMMAAWGLFDVANLVFSHALKGAGDTRFVMWYSSAMAWGLLVPVQWLLVAVLGCSVAQAWMWLAAFVWLLAAGYYLRFRTGRWKTIEVIEPLPPPGTARRGEAVVVAE
jgi:MATE family multidrug resistance protein